jgi:alpha-galactosidase
MVRAALVLVLCMPVIALAGDLLPTPPMGWNSWNTFKTRIDQKLIESTADAMVANGMRDAGYVYINLDDGWSAKQRDAAGNLVGDPQRFPGGMKALGDYLHQHGFKFGIYNCAGTETCAGYPGGRDHERQDAQTYAAWGVDYLKYDWCNTQGLAAPEAYKKMHDALAATERPIVLSICEWGGSRPWTWAKGIGQLWRTTGDIGPSWDGKEQWHEGWKVVLDNQAELAPYAGPGHWNDPDMLEVGNDGLSLPESRAHFSLWCMLAAPLIAGNDVRNMSAEVRGILTNHQVIAVDQDSLGKQATRFRMDVNSEVWVKELSDGQWAVCLLNTSASSARLKLAWGDLPFVGTRSYQVHDVWGNRELENTKTDFEGDVGSHDVMLLRLTPGRP